MQISLVALIEQPVVPASLVALIELVAPTDLSPLRLS